MGYGHRIYLDKDFDRGALADAFKDIRTLIQRTEIKVVGPEGRPNSLPIVEDDRIEFNGPITTTSATKATVRNCVRPSA